jgi:hypothetical protein
LGDIDAVMAVEIENMKEEKKKRRYGSGEEGCVQVVALAILCRSQ